MDRSCEAKGSVRGASRKTKFGESKKFLCAGSGAFPLAMSGKASDKKMKKVQVLVSSAYQLMDCEIS